MDKQKVLCRECDWHGDVSEIDHVDDPRPFPGTVASRWQVCPHCRTPEHIGIACEANECWQQATNGMRWPDEVYRWTCSKHTPLNAAAEAALSLFR